MLNIFGTINEWKMFWQSWKHVEDITTVIDVYYLDGIKLLMKYILRWMKGGSFVMVLKKARGNNISET